MIVTDLTRLSKEYGIVYTDPPWKQSKGGLRKARPNQTRELDYPTCSISDISDMHKTVIEHCSSNHNIFMWTIDRYLFDTEDMMKKLGYELHARFVWDKENGVCPAFTIRFSHEYLLWFYPKGKMLKPAKETVGKYTTVLREPSTKHSKKPECAYIMLETMFPDTNKIEMFARNERNGWDSWGNEL